MTKSELEVLRRTYGHMTPNGPIPPLTAPGPDGPVPGCLVQKDTRYHIAARSLANDGLVEIFNPVEGSPEEDIRLVRPGYREEA